jgi:hypothetical protein
VCQFLIEEALLERLEFEDALAQRKADEQAAADTAVARSKARLARVTGADD